MVKILELIILVIVLAIIVITVHNIWTIPQQDNWDCVENICVKHNLDNFNNCSYLGCESVGFLSTECYHLCDGTKVVKKCLEWEYKPVNENIKNLGNIRHGMTCTKQNKENKNENN